MKNKTCRLFRITSIALTMLMLLSLFGCGKKNAVTIGGLAGADEEDTFLKKNYDSEDSNFKKEMEAAKNNLTEFHSTSDLILALETGRIQIALLPTICCAYYASKNSDYVFVHHNRPVSFQMAVMKENAALKDDINTALNELDANGTLTRLTNSNIFNYITVDGTSEYNAKAVDAGEPTYAELPKIDGARTLKVAITGDMPPLDYTAADGKPAGFNVALMGEIAKIINCNIEFIPVTVDARTSALSSGKVDLVFWYKCRGNSELTSDTLAFTRNYFKGDMGIIGKYSSAEELNKANLNGACKSVAIKMSE